MVGWLKKKGTEFPLLTGKWRYQEPDPQEPPFCGFCRLKNVICIAEVYFY
jgi:hypothetical protein